MTRQRMAYFYTALTYQETVDWLNATLQALRSFPHKVEISYSPSRCACLRVAQVHMENMDGLPYGNGGVWHRSHTNTFPYLFKEWQEVTRDTVGRRQRYV